MSDLTTVVFLGAAALGGAALAAPFAYIAGRRSSREELAAAHMAWAVQNSAADRDDLALPPEREERPHLEPYDWDTEVSDDTWQGTLSYLRSGEQPAVTRGQS